MPFPKDQGDAPGGPDEENPGGISSDDSGKIRDENLVDPGTPQETTDTSVVFKTDLFGGGEYDLNNLTPEQAIVLRAQLEKTTKGYKTLQSQVDKSKIGSEKKDQDDGIPVGAPEKQEEPYRGRPPQLQTKADGSFDIPPEMEKAMEERNLTFYNQFDKNPLLTLLQYVSPIVEERVKVLEDELFRLKHNIEAPSEIINLVHSHIEEHPEIASFENGISQHLTENWSKYQTYEDAKQDIAGFVWREQIKKENEDLKKQIEAFKSGNIPDEGGVGGPPKPTPTRDIPRSRKEPSSIEILTTP